MSTQQESELSETRTAMLRAQNDAARMKEQLDIAIGKVSSLEKQLSHSNQEIDALKERLAQAKQEAVSNISSLEAQLNQANQGITDLKRNNNSDVIEILKSCSTLDDIINVFLIVGIDYYSKLMDVLHTSNRLMNLRHLDEMLQLDMISYNLRDEIERLRQAQCERDDLRNELEALKSSMNK